MRWHLPLVGGPWDGDHWELTAGFAPPDRIDPRGDGHVYVLGLWCAVEAEAPEVVYFYAATVDGPPQEGPRLLASGQDGLTCTLR